MAEKKRTPLKNVSFGEAVQEVEQILARLEAEQVDLDDLSREVARAVKLIKLCREKLAKTDREVRDLVADLQVEAEGKGTEASPGAGKDDKAGAGAGEEEDLPF